MIKGFEKQTEELNQYEMNTLLPVLVKHLPKKIGSDNAVTSIDIIKGLQKNGMKINGARLRKLINHIRTHNLVPLLLASSKGYYVSNSTQDTERFIESLKQREDAIRGVRIALQQQQGTATNQEFLFPK